MSTTVFDPFGDAFLADPYPQFARFVGAEPVFWSPSLWYWVVSRYDDCRRVLRDYATFSAVNSLSPLTPPCARAGSALAEGGFRSIPTLTNVDPPAHGRTRRIAYLAFTPRRVAQLEGFIRDTVRKFIADRLYEGRADIVSALTWELPARVIFQVLGVPPSDVEAIKAGSANRLLFMFGRAGEDEQVRIAEGMAEFWRYCEQLAEDRRARPRGDFTSDLVHTPDREGRPLSQQEVATILFGLLLAGHETTTNLLGNAVRRLLEHRDSWEEVCAERTTRPVVLQGVDLPAADVLVSIGAANRDPAVFTDPDRFDIRRTEASEHLSFGYGPHYCLGAPLARLEARVVLEELTAALPSLRLTPGQTFAFSPIIGFRGPTAAHVEWDPTDGA